MANDVTFHHRYTDAIGLSQRVANEAQMLDLIEMGRAIDFGAYNLRGGGTTFAHLVWNNDGSAVLEGSTGTIQVSKSAAAGVKTTDRAFAALVLKYWLVFSEAEERRKTSETAYRAQNPEPVHRGFTTHYVHGDSTFYMTDRQHLVEAVKGRHPLRFGPDDGSALVWIEWREGGNAVIHEPMGARAFGTGRTPDEIVEEWQEITREAAQEAVRAFEAAKLSWTDGLAQAVA